MKFATTFCCILVLSFSTSAQDSNWYTLGGVSLYDEDVEAAVGSGVGFRLGIGNQFNETFGLETVLDFAPAVDPKAVAAFVNSDSYDIETTGNRYLSLLLTASTSNNENVSWVGKIGFATYWAEFEGEFFDYGVSLKTEEKDQAAVISVGARFNSFELSLTKVFGDAEALSFGGVYRYAF